MKRLIAIVCVLSVTVLGTYLALHTESEQPLEPFTNLEKPKTTKTSPEERMLYTQERYLYEFNLQKNPYTGTIPQEEKEKEFINAMEAKLASAQRATASTFISRGPSNLGGRTRAMAFDISDATSNTILAGGVSSGLFRTTDGGASWTKVSPNDDIHNVTALAQDPRPGFQNIWYYGTGEWTGNSASLGSAYRGRGIWQSTDSGVTWSQIPGTDSNQDEFDSFFDYIHNLDVSPVNGNLLVAATGKVFRYDGANFTVEVEEPANGTGFTDAIYNAAGVAYAAIEGSSSANGVYTSPTGDGSWTRIAENGAPADWSSDGRIVLASAPSNNDIVYVLYRNGDSGEGVIEADLWQFDAGSTTWTDYSDKLPDEPGGDLVGNDPFAIQGGYDLVVSVKPDNANFVLIGGTNAYKIENVINDDTFARIGGYRNNLSYNIYDIGGVEHHPDIHQFEFDPNNTNIMLTGTDGGIHKTVDIAAENMVWESLNNNYQTYQFYHIALDPQEGGDTVLGGTQDNGTVFGGIDQEFEDNNTMARLFGGDGASVGLARRDGGADIQAYFSTQNGSAYTQYPNFRPIEPDGSNSIFVTYFYLDPDNQNTLYYAGQQTLYRTINAETVTTVVDASNWTDMGALPIGQNIRTLATSPGTYSASSYLLIGGQNGRIYRLDDPQNQADLTTAVEITPVDASTASGAIVSAFAINPSNPDEVIACYANYGINNIFHTTNATAATPTWTLIERNLSSHSIRSAAIAEDAGETIYFIGTARGLYSSNDPINEDWDLEGPDEMGLAVVSRLVYRPSDKLLLIGTHGNGMYQTTVEGTLSTNDVSFNNNDLSVYPNPAQFKLNFKSNSLNLDNVKYDIYNMNGQKVKQGVINNKIIDVSQLQSGIYFVNVDISNSNEVIKFIKK